MRAMATIEDVLACEDPTDFAIALSNLVFPRYDQEGFASLTPDEQVAYCVDALEREVNNGGFDQFFLNSSGDTVPETLAALEAIGAAQVAAMLREAVSLFPGGEPPRDREERYQRALGAPEATREAWNGLDSRFYDYPDDLTALMRAFVTRNRSGFRPW